MSRVLELSQLCVGETAHVLALQAGKSTYRSRLMAMGIVPGVPLTLVRKAPLGDPLEIRVAGASIMLRSVEAKIVELSLSGGAV